MERLTEALRRRGWECDSDGIWVRPPDHPGQLRRVRREERPLERILEHILASRYYGGEVREDLRAILYAHLVAYGWHVDGRKIRDPAGVPRQAASALKRALGH
jgi:hypothetical protein